MAIKQAMKQQLSVSQNMTMTPQLIQSIKLLQYANNELCDYVNKIAETNPFVEVGEAASEQQESTKNNEQDNLNENIEPERPLDANLDDIYPDLAPADKNIELKSSKDFAEQKTANETNHWSKQLSLEEYDWQKSLVEQKTMREALVEQLFVLTDNKLKRRIGLDLIENTEDSGYTRADIEYLAKKHAVKAEIVEEQLLEMQQFEPTGIMARNLAECLKIQLMEKNQYDKSIQILLKNLHDLAYSKAEKLCKLCDIKPEQLAYYTKKIRALNPKPGEKFIKNKTETLIPDVIVTANENEVWKIAINKDILPKILIDKEYYIYVNKKVSKDEKEFVNNNYHQANWLARTIEQRSQTILKVASQIVTNQDQFLVYGIEYLKPMTLKNIAEAVKMHESTISRTIHNKFMSTPAGIFPFKFFFCTAIKKNDDNAQSHTNTKIKHLIKNMIDNEDNRKILSDQLIVDILHENGIDIARRTVTKYRKAMKIPSSARRRRQRATIV